MRKQVQQVNAYFMVHYGHYYVLVHYVGVTRFCTFQTIFPTRTFRPYETEVDGWKQSQGERGVEIIISNHHSAPTAGNQRVDSLGQLGRA